MRAQIHPGVFLASAIALSASWLWLRPAPPARPAPPSSPPSAGAAARPAAAARPSVRVDDAILRRYAGRYRLEGFVVTVSVDGERLLVDAGDPRPAVLRAASETKFFFDAFPGGGEITFEAGDPAKGFVVDMANGRYRATRVGN